MTTSDKWNYQDVWFTEFKGRLRFAGFLLILLAVFVSNIFAADIKSVQSGNWSDANTWNTGAVPGQGDNVLIDSSHVVTYDVFSDKEIRLIHIRGTLEFSRSVNTQLDVGMIIISTSETVHVNANCSMHHHGPFWPEAPRPALEVGTIADPIPANITARIRLKYFSDMSDDCAPGIICYGGRMDIHGAPLNKTWVKLAASVSAGATTLPLAEAVEWKVGDHIIVTRSKRPNGNIINTGSYRTNGQIQTEEKYITAVNGNSITIDSPLQHDRPKRGDKAAEVAVLSRNVVIESKDPQGVRGHTMYHHNSLGSISYAEFAHLGKAGKLARYPIHYHVLRNTMRGSSVIGASIWDSHNRFVTIHGTDYLVVRDCVGYKSLGHGYFMEDGSEVFNFLDHNLAVQTFDTGKLPDQALEFDENDGAGFWWANGRNAFLNNVAVETDRYGYQFETSPEVQRSVLQPDGSIQSNVQINRLGFLLFKGNEAHNTMEYGFAGEDGDAYEDEPFLIEDLYAWGMWRAIRPDFNNYYLKNFRLWNVAYGFYGQYPKSGRIEGFEAIRTGNEAMGFTKEPEGLITFQDVTVDSANEYPFQIENEKPHQYPCEIHIKNYTVTNVEDDRYGARADDNTREFPDITLYLHDWFGPGQDAKVIPVVQSRNDGLNYQTMTPVFRNDVKVAVTNVPFPNNPIHLDDDMPPATVIIYPAPLQEFSSQTGEITVIGTCIDASDVTSVTVNGTPATPLAENYTRWQATLTNLPQGMVTIESKATDEFGNVELNPHRITIGIGATPTGTNGGNPIAGVPQNFELGDNFPNPFNPETNIRFTVSDNEQVAGSVQIIIYDVLGHRVRELVNGSLPPGEHVRTWDGHDDNGNPMASGVYIYEMIARNGSSSSVFKQAKKMLLLR